MNEHFLPGLEFRARRDDPRAAVVRAMRMLLRFRLLEIELSMTDTELLRDCISLLPDEARSLHVIGHALSGNTPDSLGRSTRCELANKIDAVLDTPRAPETWYRTHLEPLERLAGRDPAKNPVIAEFRDVIDRLPDEVDILLAGLGAWYARCIRGLLEIGSPNDSPDGSWDSLKSEMAEAANAFDGKERAKFLLGYFELKKRLNSRFWRTAGKYQYWGVPFAAGVLPRVFGNESMANSLVSRQLMRKIDFTPDEARAFLAACCNTSYSFLIQLPVAKRLAALLSPEDREMAEFIESSVIAPKPKKALMEALEPAIETSDDPASTDRVSEDRSALFAHIAANPGLWIPIDAGEAAADPEGSGESWSSLAQQIAPCWSSSKDYLPKPEERVDFAKYIDTVTCAVLEGANAEHTVDDLRDLYAAAVRNLNRIRAGDGTPRSPQAMIEQGEVQNTMAFRALLPVEIGYQDPIPATVAREDVVKAEEETIERLKAAIDRIDGLLSDRKMLAWERANMPPESASRPSAKWLKAAQAGFDAAAVQQRLAELAPFHAAISYWERHNDLPANSWFVEQQMQRASVWAARLCPAEEIGPVLSDFALRCYVTVSGIGIKAEKLGNAALSSLEALPEGAGTPYLARVLSRVRYPKIRKRIDASLNAAAKAAGITRGELDETSVPDHGLLDGPLQVPLAEGAALIALDRGKATLSWKDAEGKVRKSPPKSLKEADPEGIKNAKALAKEVEKDFATQVHRLERLFLQNRCWDAETWDEHYASHGTVGLLARKLLWMLERPDGSKTVVLPADNGCQDMDGSRVSLKGAAVRLWHPLMSPQAEIEAWRERLFQLELVQPFRQVWRETYALTDAERETGTYSNRFAGHILRQHQMITLARLNAWNCTHRMDVDAPNNEPAHLWLPEYGLYAEFWTEGAGGNHPPTLDSGAYVYLTTDRVRFHRLAENQAFGQGELLPLTEVPSMVLSEVLRHCDLFTSVASIAMDAEWMDKGSDAEHPDQWRRDVADTYWNRTFNAELSPSSKVRRDFLGMIIPRLANFESFRLEERYLFVQGKMNAYRIHLSSAGVIKIPQNRHVCILPKFSKSSAVSLPFGGDQTLSLILSKAMLLAKDDQITDPVILAQI